MNYCEKITYRIFTAEQNDTFPLTVEQLLEQIPANEHILRLTFFGAPATNEEYITHRTILKDKLQKHYGEQQPSLSYVAQPPLNATLILEVHSYLPDSNDKITYKRLDNYPCVLLENNHGRFLFGGGFQSDIIEKTIEEQSIDVFKIIDRLLLHEHFPINSIIRQWNYIEQITAIRNNCQNYQSFNNARGDFYAKTPWTCGYPAATGIGTGLGGVLVDLDLAVFTSPKAFTTPIDNKLQVAAHAYSGKVLETAGSKKATPKFERAKSMTFGNKRLIYISGTAAIRGEESLRRTNLPYQLQVTMENIAQLTHNASPVMFRVYLKHKKDYESAAQLMRQYTSAPVSFMYADVCREELLIEIEGIAVEL